MATRSTQPRENASPGAQRQRSSDCGAGGGSGGERGAVRGAGCAQLACSVACQHAQYTNVKALLLLVQQCVLINVVTD